MKRIIFWQGIMSIHQSALIRNVANIHGFDLTLVVEKEADPKRLAMGWHCPDFGNCKIIIQPSDRLIVDLIEQDIKETVHIFSGIHPIPMGYKAFKKAIKLNAHIGIYSETVNWLSIKGKMKWIRDRLYAFNYRDKIDFILAIGHLGVNCYQQSGYLKSTIFPFGYFVETPSKSQNDMLLKKQPDGTTVHLGFIGQLIKRKGVDLLLKSLADLKHLDWHLKIIGNGPDRAEFESLCNENGLLKRVSFLGAIHNKEASQMLAEIDLFILPSRWDGWGAVVNEALMRGVPVICSDYCGAADLLHNDERGEVFKAGSVDDLTRVLNKWIAKGPLKPSDREKIQLWSKCIEGESAAQYLYNIIEYSQKGGKRPITPWFSNN